jgi:serine/threonine-protein kinase
MGVLRINSRPWSQVTVDGRVVGNTPQQALQLTAGTHRIQLVNDQMGMRKAVNITIKAGETVTQVLNLSE